MPLKRAGYRTITLAITAYNTPAVLVDIAVTPAGNLLKYWHDDGILCVHRPTDDGTPWLFWPVAAHAAICKRALALALRMR